MRMGVLGKTGGYRVTTGSAINFGKIALDVNYSLDLLTQLTPLNRVSIAVRFNFGDQGRKALAGRIDALYLEGLDAYAAGRYELAATRWREVLELNPKFDPAREGIELIENSRALDDRMLEMQTLDF
jgi:hypothetical protein